MFYGYRLCGGAKKWVWLCVLCLRSGIIFTFISLAKTYRGTVLFSQSPKSSFYSFKPETEYDFIRIIAENNNNASFQDVFKHLMF